MATENSVELVGALHSVRIINCLQQNCVRSSLETSQRCMKQEMQVVHNKDIKNEGNRSPFFFDFQFQV